MKVGPFVRLATVALWLLILAGRSVADVSVSRGEARLEAEARSVTILSGNGSGVNPVQNQQKLPTLSEVQNVEREASVTAQGATGAAQQRSQLQASGQNLSFSASGSTSATAPRTGNDLVDPETGALGTFSFSMTFQVDSESTFSLSGSVSVDTTGTTESSEAQVVLSGEGERPINRSTRGDGEETEEVEVNFDFDAVDAKGKPRNITFGKSGVLFPGRYTITVFAISSLSENQSSSKCSAQVTLTVNSPPRNPEPDDGEEIRWVNRNGGNFFDPENWKPKRVPTKTATRSDTAVFGLPTDFGVDVGGVIAAAGKRGDPSAVPRVERIRLTNGAKTTLNGSGLNALGGSLLNPSVLVDGGAELSLTAGKLFSTNALVRSIGDISRVRVENEGSTWENTGRITLSGGSFAGGFLDVGNGGRISTKETVLKQGSNAIAVENDSTMFETGDLVLEGPRGNLNTLGIDDGGSVVSESARIGTKGGDNLVVVSSLSSWTVRKDLEIGRSGTCFVSIDNSFLECGTLTLGGVVSDGGAMLSVSGLNGFMKSGRIRIARTGELAISNIGLCEINGSVTVDGGGLLSLEGPTPAVAGLPIVGQLVVGASSGPTAEVRITDGTPAVVASDVFIGDRNGGRGLVSISNSPSSPTSKLLVLGNLGVGGSGGAGGNVVLANGLLDVIGNLTVESNGAVSGVGNLTIADGSVVTNNGIIQPGLSPGKLTIRGKFNQGPEGRIVAEVAGPTAGTEHDQLVIEGDATFEGKLVLQFMNGFAPAAGQTFQVVNGTGAMEGSFSSVEIMGLKEGAQFETEMQNGMVTAKALNATEALPPVSIKAVGKGRASEKRRKPVAFLISRTGDKSAPLTVNYEIEGRAENGLDYTFLPGSVTIPKGKSAVAVKARPIDDSDTEGDESVTLRIIPGAEYATSLQASATASVIDNEKLPSR